MSLDLKAIKTVHDRALKRYAKWFAKPHPIVSAMDRLCLDMMRDKGAEARAAVDAAVADDMDAIYAESRRDFGLPPLA